MKRLDLSCLSATEAVFLPAWLSCYVVFELGWILFNERDGPKVKQDFDFVYKRPFSKSNV
jgi:hypothetical protein